MTITEKNYSNELNLEFYIDANNISWKLFSRTFKKGEKKTL